MTEPQQIKDKDKAAISAYFDAVYIVASCLSRYTHICRSDKRKKICAKCRISEKNLFADLD